MHTSRWLATIGILFGAVSERVVSHHFPLFPMLSKGPCASGGPLGCCWEGRCYQIATTRDIKQHGLNVYRQTSSHHTGHVQQVATDLAWEIRRVNLLCVSAPIRWKLLSRLGPKCYPLANQLGHKALNRVHVPQDCASS